MSGLLRRIKRSRAADAGEAPAEGQAAGPEGARTTAETSAGDAGSAETAETSAGDADSAGTAATPAGEHALPGGDASSAATTELPAAAPAGDADPHAAEAGAAPRGRRPGRFGGRLRSLRWRHEPADPVAAGPAIQPTPPPIQADPHRPAGLDPAEAGAAPPSGRRGRLRRRLRYLRRARELMLRDLGGLLYEVHRTAGGDVAAHSTVIGAKVERLSRLDAESERIEAALGAPRSETVVFQPGVGGTCKACGELYGSTARFCSNCGSPTGSAARMTPAPVEPRTVPAMPKLPAEKFAPRAADAGEPAATAATAAPAETAAAQGPESSVPREIEARGGEDDTSGGELAPQADERPVGSDADESRVEPPADETREAQPPEPGEPREEPPNPFSGLSNGRPEDRTPPELSSGDPLSSREGRP